MNTPETPLTEIRRTRILAGLRHLEPETLQAYAGGAITDAAESARIEEHLFECEECLAEYNAAFDAVSPYKAAFDTFLAKQADIGSQPEKKRLIAVLEHLGSVYGESKERLLWWRDQLLAEGGRYGASLTAFLRPTSQGSYVKVLRELSSPAISVVLVSGTRNAGRNPSEEADAGDDLVILEKGWLNVDVRVTSDSVTLAFLDWTASVAPLVILIPEGDVSGGLLPDHVESTISGEFEVRFEKVPQGAYLLSIAPAE